MSYIISSFAIILAWLKKKSKIIFFLLFILLWVLYGFNNNNPDYNNYEATYNYIFRNLNGEIKEFGFLALLKIFNYIGASYQTFLIIISLIGLFLISDTIWKFSPYPNLVFTLYFIFPFPIDVVQLRFFLAMAIVIFSLRFLIYYYRFNKKRNILYFILSIFVATSIHYSAVLYLVMLVPCFANRKNKYIYSILLIIFIGGLAFKIESIVPIVSKFLSSMKIEKWIISNTSKSLTMIIRIFIIRYSWLCICILACLLQKKCDNTKTINIYKQENEFILNLILSLTSLTALEMFINSEYERITRVTLILGYILISRCISKKRNDTYILWLITLCYVIAYFLFSMFFRDVTKNEITWFEGVFRAIFENNIIIH